MEPLEIISLVAAIITAPLSSWLTAKLLRKKYDAEVDGLRAQVEASKADTRGDELANVKEAMSILMEQVVEPLKKEINAIRKELARLRRAVEKANRCPFADHADACPVLYELRRAEDVEGHAREPTGA
ncbi:MULTISPECIES: hypothetical protein [Bacteroidales]|mgnify:FL=1|jgi:hypothetical protein|uniref:hypothetical protein n=1 Tax=Bacteroidales TaxID=171549 RepID=UPI000930CC6B|nr:MULTISPECIES: hypothetical protein [Bacteroidales]